MKRFPGLLAPLLLLALLAADWPQFRGPGGSAVSEERDLPVKWGKGAGLRWKADLPGRGLSSPVVAADRVYVTACSGYRETRLHVLCFEVATGRKVWERQFTATGNTACNPSTNMAAPSPAADAGAVYALFATGDLAAISRDGALLWYRSLVGDYPDVTNQVGLAASPALAGDVLLLPLENVGDSFAAGLDKKTGKNLWRVKRPRAVNWVSPIVFPWAGRTAALFQTATDATAYDSATGKVLWSYAGKGLSPIKSPAQGSKLVFLAGEQLVAIRPRENQPPIEVWRTGNLLEGYASPVYHDGRVYYLTPAAAVCANAADGKEVWRQRVEGPFDASPVVGAGKLYATNNRGRTTVLALGDRPKVLSRNDLGDAVQATPAAAEGCIYFRSEKALYCVGPPGGE
jgi:outer membrane protein assembly factor BamB